MAMASTSLSFDGLVVFYIKKRKNHHKIMFGSKKYLSILSPILLLTKHKVYLSAILDFYDRRIVAYVISDRNDNPLVFETFDKAIAANPGASALCHSDRGFQYTNRNFHARLEAAGMTQSMSRVAKCIDNGPMEGFWGILKRERYYGNRFTDRDSLVKMIEDYIEYYNHRRLQRNLGVLTPMEKHEQYLAVA